MTGCLTVGSRPARIGIDVLVRAKHEADGHQATGGAHTPQTEDADVSARTAAGGRGRQAARLGAHLEVGRQFYNAVLSAGQRRLRRMRADPAWQAARAIPRTQRQERKPPSPRCGSATAFPSTPFMS